MHLHERLPAVAAAVLQLLEPDEPLSVYARLFAAQLTGTDPMLRALLLALVMVALSGCNATRVSNEMTAATSEGKIVAGDGVHLGYRKIGNGPRTVVVLHGGPGFTMDYLAEDLTPLADTHTVVFYDQRGTGRSTLVSDAAALDAQRFADDLEAVRRYFGPHGRGTHAEPDGWYITEVLLNKEAP